MRTTITLDDALARKLKSEAEKRGMTVSEYLARAARAALAREGVREEAAPYRLVTFHGDGPQPGVDLDRTSEVLDLLEQLERR